MTPQHPANFARLRTRPYVAADKNCIPRQAEAGFYLEPAAPLVFRSTGIYTSPFGDYASQERIDADLARASAFQHPRRAARTLFHIFPMCYHAFQQDTLESALFRASTTAFPRNDYRFAPHGRGDLSTLPPLPPTLPQLRTLWPPTTSHSWH